MSLARKIIIPSLLPFLFVTMWVCSKFLEANIPWYLAIGMFCITTAIPSGLALWYGWELKKEFSNE